MVHIKTAVKAELLQVKFGWDLAITFPLMAAEKIPSVVCKATTKGSRILRLLVAAGHMLVAFFLVQPACCVRTVGGGWDNGSWAHVPCTCSAAVP